MVITVSETDPIPLLPLKASNVARMVTASSFVIEDAWAGYYVSHFYE